MGSCWSATKRKWWPTTSANAGHAELSDPAREVKEIDPIPVAVVGAGAFGRQHARVYRSLEDAQLVAVVDQDGDRARQVAAEFGCEALTDTQALSGRVLAASLAVPTQHHASVGVALLKQGIDLLVEKPIAADVESGKSLVSIAERENRVLQVGHLERFNPIVEEASSAATLPLFFEVHRLSPFSPRSLDVDVVLDLMIHDLDLVLTLVASDIDQINASGLSVVSSRPDIANARIQFKNGCVANLTASRVSTEKIRKLRFFQPRQYVSIDYIRREGVCIGLDEGGQLRFVTLRPDDGEPLQRQLRAFVDCVRNRSAPRVSGLDGLRALELAIRIREAIEEHSRLVAKTVAASK